MACTEQGFLIFLNVPNSLLKQGDDVRVNEAVIHLLPLPPRNHQLHLTQSAQVVRHCRLADANQVRQNADVLFTVQQGRHDLYAAGITKGPEEFRKRVLRGLGQPGAGRQKEAVQRYAEGLLR